MVSLVRAATSSRRSSGVLRRRGRSRGQGILASGPPAGCERVQPPQPAVRWRGRMLRSSWKKPIAHGVLPEIGLPRLSLRGLSLPGLRVTAPGEVPRRGFTVTWYDYATDAPAQILDEVDGFIKLVWDPNSTRLVGVQILGVDAAQLIAPLALAVHAGSKAAGPWRRSPSPTRW